MDRGYSEWNPRSLKYKNLNKKAEQLVSPEFFVVPKIKVCCGLVVHSDTQTFEQWLKTIPSDISVVKIRSHSQRLWLLTGDEVKEGTFKP